MSRTNPDNILTGSSLKEQERKFNFKRYIILEMGEGAVSFKMFYIATDHENFMKSSVYLNIC